MILMKSFSFGLSIVTLFPFCLAAPGPRASSSPCTGTIASLDDIDDAVACDVVNIESFTVPAGKTFEINLADNSIVNLGMLRQIIRSPIDELTTVGSGRCRIWE